jgi:hypothetical protein
MVIPNAVAYGVLVSVGLLILLAFLVVFMRPERPKRIEEDRPPMPVGWPTITASATSPVKPVRLRALWRRSRRS